MLQQNNLMIKKNYYQKRKERLKWNDCRNSKEKWKKKREK